MKTKASIKIQRLLGFTLIELLFVVAIFSVLATLGITFVKQHAAETKIETAAKQMQQILQAGMAYHVDHGRWPKETDIGFKENYISSENIQDPWGNKYNFCPTEDSISGTCSKNAYANLFQVQAAANLSNATSERIREKLSNASICKIAENKYVYAQTTLPQTESVYVEKTGQTTIKENSTIQDIKVQCPPGYLSKIDFNHENLLGNFPKISPNVAPPLNLYSSPYETIIGGGCNGNGTCLPYKVQISTRYSGEEYSIDLDKNKKSFKATLLYKYKQSSSFWHEYSLNYTIYCCRVDGEEGGRKTSSYCPNPYSL